MHKLGLGIFVDYTVAGLNYRWIIQIINLTKNEVKSKSTNTFSSFPQQPVYFFLYFSWWLFFKSQKAFMYRAYYCVFKLTKSTTTHQKIRRKWNLLYTQWQFRVLGSHPNLSLWQEKKQMTKHIQDTPRVILLCVEGQFNLSLVFMNCKHRYICTEIHDQFKAIN